MIEPTRRRGFSEPYGSWKIIWMSRRSGRIWRGFRSVMSWPSNEILPPVTGYSRATQRARVDLPQPVSPTRPSVSPRRTSRLDALDRVHELVLALNSLLDFTGKCLTRLSTCSSTSPDARPGGGACHSCVISSPYASALTGSD